MKLTAIQAQKNRADRFSIFIDGKYSFSLSADSLLKSGLIKGQDLSKNDLIKLKKRAESDMVWQRLWAYALRRQRSKKELSNYLRLKGISDKKTSVLLNKLEDKGLINDKALAQAIISSAGLRRPQSKLKLRYHLKKRGISDELINDSIKRAVPDSQALIRFINQKKLLNRYQDKTKLMRYLAAQGYNYEDIKEAIKQTD